MAEAHLTTALSSLAAAAERLNSVSDSVNRILSDVEATLVATNVGIEVWLEAALTSTDAEGSTQGETSWIAEFLGFAKINGDWRLATKSKRFVSGFFQGDTSCPYLNQYLAAEPKPLAQSPRDLRIAALERLPELVELLASEAERYTAAVEKASLVGISVL